MALDTLEIRGGIPLKGTVSIAGAKNAALPAMALTLLTPEKCVLRNVPRLHDVTTMQNILEYLGARVLMHDEGTSEYSAEKINKTEAPYDFVRKMRASILLLGPLLARFGSAKVSMPGGCAIGVRPIDQHLKAMAALGARILLSDGYVEAKAEKLTGAEYTFEQVTVTGTINAMMVASKAKGRSVFKNSAREPEVVFCGELLRDMGADIEGLGTATIAVTGTQELQGFDRVLIPDRIETGTYMVAAAITEGELILKGCRPGDLAAVIQTLRACGVIIEAASNGQITISGQRPYKPVRISTQPHPGFPTDMQAQLMALLCLAEGESSITENIFENRFMHVPELLRMGADIQIDGSDAFIRGIKSFRGAPVMATDLRASACLVLAALAATGTSKVARIYHLDRGYEKMESKLAKVGADIRRLT